MVNLIEKWEKDMIYYQNMAEKYSDDLTKNRKFTYKAQQLKYCIKDFKEELNNLYFYEFENGYDKYGVDTRVQKSDPMKGLENMVSNLKDKKENIDILISIK